MISTSPNTFTGQNAFSRTAHAATSQPNDPTFRSDGKATPISGLYRTSSIETSSNGFQKTPINGLLGRTPLATEHFRPSDQSKKP